MDNIVLENFINFCDDMMIAEEGFKDTKLFSLLEKGWEFIKNAVLKLLSKISSFLVKKISKGDKVLVNSEFVNGYRDIEGKITGRTLMDADAKKEISKMIDSFMEKSIKADSFKNESLSISDISNKLNAVSKDLESLKKDADKALTQVKLARKRYEQAKNEKENIEKERDNVNIDGATDFIIKSHNSTNNVLDKEYSYSSAKSALEDANNKLFKCELYIKLYTGVRNKLAPSND